MSSFSLNTSDCSLRIHAVRSNSHSFQDGILSVSIEQTSPLPTKTKTRWFRRVMKFECNDYSKNVDVHSKLCSSSNQLRKKFSWLKNTFCLLVLYRCRELVFVINIWKIPLGLSNTQPNSKCLISYNFNRCLRSRLGQIENCLINRVCHSRGPGKKASNL